jgi:hypothetical protein
MMNDKRILYGVGIIVAIAIVVALLYYAGMF